MASNAEKVSIWWRHHVDDYQTRTNTDKVQIVCIIIAFWKWRWNLHLRAGHACNAAGHVTSDFNMSQVSQCRGTRTNWFGAEMLFPFSDKYPINWSPVVSLQRASNAENIPNMMSSRCITNASPLHYLQIVGQTSTINAVVRQYYSQAISQSANKPDMSFANGRVVFWQVFAEATNLIHHLHPQKGLNFVICMNSIVSRVSFSMMSWHT